MSSEAYRIGPFRLDVSARMLFRNTEALVLGQRAVALLQLLVEQPGELVSKDRLIAAAWEGLAVDESNLTVQIASLRRVLGEEPGGDRWIETLPRRGYRYVGPVASKETKLPAATAWASGPLPLPDKPSIAVLPFHNLSDDVRQEYFADGIVEDIIAGLSRMKWLFVIARNSSLAFKGKGLDIKEIGRSLGVRYVLEGSVRRSENRIRIATQLVEAASGRQTWAERYDRVIDDIFAVQDDITVSVLAALEPNLQRLEIERVKRDRPASLDAYDLMLRALPFLHVYMPRAIEPAIALLSKALELEPDFARAHAQLARCYHIRFSRGGLNEQDRVAAIRHARAAMASDDATTLALAALVTWFRDDVATAFDLYDRALAISNSNATALGNSAFGLAWMGKPDEAIERATRALRFSPLEPLFPYLALSVAHFHAGRYEASRGAALRAVEASPGFSGSWLYLAAPCQRLGRFDEAKGAADQTRVLDPTFTIRTISFSIGKLPDVFSPFAEAWREAGLPDQ